MIKDLKMLGIEIKGYGHYFPETILTNDEIKSRLKYPEMHPAEKAVIGNIGVDRRFRANEKETSVYMAAKTAEMAMKDAGVSPEEIDLLLFCNWTDRFYLPDLAPQVSVLLGTKNSLAFDLSTACTGFVHGVQTASMYLSSGRFKKALVLGSDTFSIRTRMGGYGEYTAGDASGGVVLEYTGTKDSGLIDFCLFNDGNLSEIITVSKQTSIIKSYPDLVVKAAHYTLEMMDYLMEKNGLKPDDITWVIPHPGTDVVVQSVLSNSKVPKEKFLMNFHYCGNTSAASIPTVLSEEKHKGTFKKGDIVLCPAVGGGFYWGGLLFKF